MKNLTKKQLTISSIILVIILLLIGFFLNVFDIKDKTTESMSKTTIPFNLIVNPKKIDQGVKPKSIKLDTDNFDSEKNHVIKMVNNINNNFKDNHKLYFLSTDQQKQLNDMVSKKSHQYIYQITALNFGKDIKGKYFTISCNQYGDSKQITSYRYILHYKKNQITTSKYIGKKHAKYPPQFLLDDIKVGTPGIKQSKGFLQQLKTALINSNLTSNQSNVPGDFDQIAINLGLKDDASNDALYQLTKNSNSRLSNFAITGYELSDVPRKSRIYVKQMNQHRNYYYTLTFDRNSKKFSTFQTGIHSNRNSN